MTATTTSAPAVPAAPTWPRWVAVLASVAALVAVLFDAGAKGIWYDEGFTLYLVDGSLGHLWDGISAGDVNQSPYYVLFWGWYHLFGHDEATMRLLSGLCAAATVPFVHLIGRRLHDARVGALAAVLVALHAEVVGWGQQLRGYSAVLLAVTVATWLFLRAIERPTTGRALLYALVATVAVYSHFLAGLVVVAHALSLLALRPRPRHLLVVAGGALVVTMAPLAVFLSGVSSEPLEWIPQATIPGLYERLADVAGGGALQLAAYVAGGALGLAAAVVPLRRRWGTAEAWRWAVGLLWVAVPVGAVVVSAFGPQPLLVARYLIIVVPGMALVAAAGVVWLADQGRRPVAAAAAAVLLGSTALGLAQWYRSPGVEDWRTVAAVVLDEIGPDDTVVFAPGRARFSFGYYAEELGREIPPSLGPSADDPPGGPRLYEMQRGRRTEVSRRRIPEFGEWLERHYELAEERTYRGIVVRTWLRR